MRRKIVQRTRKALFQAGLYSLLLSLLSTPTSGWAAGWTQEFGKVIGTQSNNSVDFFIYLDPLAANNVNNCAGYINSEVSGWVGQNVAAFSIRYPTGGAPSEAQKVMISQISLAAAAGKHIKLYLDSCNTTTYNNVHSIWLKPN